MNEICLSKYLKDKLVEVWEVEKNSNLILGLSCEQAVGLNKRYDNELFSF